MKNSHNAKRQLEVLSAIFLMKFQNAEINIAKPSFIDTTHKNCFKQLPYVVSKLR